jgi:hypothetical protein
MVLGHATRLLLYSTLLLGSAGCCVATVEDDPVLGIIPVSALAPSASCDRISEIQEQLQGQLTAQDIQRIEGPEQHMPLTPSGKFRLAVINVSDPFAIGTTALDAEISNVTSKSTSAFGNGAAGFGRRFGMSMADEASSEFFATFLVSSIFHQDPHYHRDPGAGAGRRIGYALSRVVISRSDFGKPMFNYAEVLGTTAAATFEDSYHFERDQSPGATSQRIFVSIGSDAAWNLLTEFLPDVAKHVNPRLILLRRLAERAAQQNSP